MLSPAKRIPWAPSSNRSLKTIPMAFEGKNCHHSPTSVFDVTMVLPVFITIHDKAEKKLHLFRGVRKISQIVQNDEGDIADSCVDLPKLKRVSLGEEHVE